MFSRPQGTGGHGKGFRPRWRVGGRWRSDAPPRQSRIWWHHTVATIQPKGRPHQTGERPTPQLSPAWAQCRASADTRLNLSAGASCHDRPQAVSMAVTNSLHVRALIETWVTEL
jgi:hypothetical protein